MTKLQGHRQSSHARRQLKLKDTLCFLLLLGTVYQDQMILIPTAVQEGHCTVGRMALVTSLVGMSSWMYTGYWISRGATEKQANRSRTTHHFMLRQLCFWLIDIFLLFFLTPLIITILHTNLHVSN